MEPPGRRHLLIGRAPQRAVLVRSLAELEGGAGGAVLVEGEAGIGKTRLVQWVVESAGERGIRVMAGACRSFERTRPFAAVREALRLRGGSPDDRRAGIARLLSGEDRRPGAAEHDVRHRVVEEVVDLVESECGHGPLLLALEDLHWADDSTLIVVRSLLDRLGDLPVLLVATMRPAPASSGLDLLLADAISAGLPLLQLAPLSAVEVGELVRAETGSSPGPALARAVGRAAGNPLWVVEILRALATEGLPEADGQAAALPDSLRQLVLRRMRELPDATLRCVADRGGPG